MRVAGKTITVFLVMFLATAPMAIAQQQPEMSYKQAQRAVIKAMSFSYVFAPDKQGPELNNVRLTQDTLEFDAKGMHFTIPLKELHKLTPLCNQNGCWVREEGTKQSHGNGGSFLSDYNAQKTWSKLCFGWGICTEANHDECENSGKLFVAALNSLHIYALGPTLPEDDFHKQATAWRALAEKPALPDAARVRRLLAEDAIKNKKPADALMYYEQALEAYPTWPEGWFNAALVAGELGRYDDAVDNMQTYLELVPDAKDAQSARDQMEMWKIRAQTKR